MLKVCNWQRLPKGPRMEKGTQRFNKAKNGTQRHTDHDSALAQRPDQMKIFPRHLISLLQYEVIEG